MSAWDHLYQFWISEQGLAGGIVGDLILGGGTYLVGKYKVGPWLHQRHKEHLEQKERQHREIVQAHKALFDLHERHHQELLDATRQASAGQPIQTSPAPTYESADGGMPPYDQ
jgi:hypothetical protein